FAFSYRLGSERSDVYNCRDPGKILHEYTGRFVWNIFIGSFRLPVKQRLHIFLGNRKVIKVTQGVFQQNPNGKWKLVDIITLLLKLSQTPVIQAALGSLKLPLYVE